MQIGEEEKTVIFPKRVVAKPVEPIPAENWPVKRQDGAPIPVENWPAPASVPVKES
jgi:hypothetical protein